MDFEDDFLYEDEDSGHEIEDDDDEDFIGMEMEPEPSSAPDKRDVDDYPYEVLSPEQIVQHMVDCIKEVNAIVEVCIGRMVNICSSTIRLPIVSCKCVCCHS